MNHRHRISLLAVTTTLALAGMAAKHPPARRPGAIPPKPALRLPRAPTWKTGGIRGELNATRFPGPDIGARVNAAIAALPGGCGTIAIPAGTYTYATKIVKPRCVRLNGEGAGTSPGGRGGTVLRWTPRSGAALAIGDSRGGAAYPTGGIADLTIQGPGAATPTVGLWLGGDPAARVLPQKDFAESQGVRNVRITGFGTGVEWGNNAWVERFYHDEIFANGSGINAAVGATNTAEQNDFVAVSIFNNAGPALAADEDFHFVGTSFDFNGAPSVGANFIDCHFEQSSGLFVQGEYATIIGGLAYLDATKGSDEALFAAKGRTPGEWYIAGLEVGSNHPVREGLEWSMPANSKLFIADLRGNASGRIGSATNAPYMYGSYVNAQLYQSWRTPVELGATMDLGGGEFRNSAQGGAWNVKLNDDWANDPTPYKYLSSSNGDFSILDSAGTRPILRLTDSGAISWGGGPEIRDSAHTGGGPIVLANSPHITGVPKLPRYYRVANRLVKQPQDSGTIALTSQLPLSAVSHPIGGAPLAAGKCLSTAVAVAGATRSSAVVVTPEHYPGDGTYWGAYIPKTGVIEVKVCATVAATPARSKYQVRAIH
jgi:hypothetical protein